MLRIGVALVSYALLMICLHQVQFLGALVTYVVPADRSPSSQFRVDL
jgi:hypothetical protein